MPSLSVREGFKLLPVCTSEVSEKEKTFHSGAFCAQRLPSSSSLYNASLLSSTVSVCAPTMDKAQKAVDQ